jgi:hypothetical protein
MVLGSYTFEKNPSEVPVVTDRRHAASVKTYSSVAFFSWGADIIGARVTLSWRYMPAAQYTALAGLLAADDTVVLDPQDGTSNTYNVEVLNLAGAYYINMATGVRKNVTLDLLILSEVS